MTYKDNELVEMISDNSEDARDMLYEKYKYIVDIIINKYKKSAYYLNIDSSELKQEALLGFSDALASYNPDKDSSLPTFISLCVERRVGNYVRKNDTHKMHMIKDAISLDSKIGPDDSDMSLQDILKGDKSPEEKVVEQEDLEKLKKDIKEALSPSEYEIYELLINDFSYEDISKITKKPIKVIYNIVYRIRGKIKNLI